MNTRSFPGRLTLEEWLVTPLRKRINLIARAQCDLLGSFRFCTKKRCRRLRTCCGNDPNHCSSELRHRHHKRHGGMAKVLRHEWQRLNEMRGL
ncbi:MAG TPA: hypothetical protein VH206_02135 [Xanthobacteraceae bacterium]|jgi:hypothetical protein|nr:hypothetical protein [Xanthobacteraceae bacterium]